MPEVTITEALAEIKLLSKRIASKQESVMRYLARSENMRDPLEKEGGSAQYVKSELQSLDDLQENVVRIRRAIAAANAGNTITLGGETRSIADWLTWRREVAPIAQKTLVNMQNVIQQARNEATKRGGVLKDGTESTKPGDVVVNVSEKALSEMLDAHNIKAGTLDGQLSLKNATIRIAW